MFTRKAFLALAVSLVAVSALRAGTGTVARVNHENGHSCKTGLVLDEGSQLTEGPTGMFRSLPLPNSCPFANVGQVFQPNPASGAFGFGNDALADAVILMTAKTTFTRPKAFEDSLGGLGSFLLKVLAGLAETTANRFCLLTREGLPFAGSCYLNDAEIDADEICRGDGSSIRQVYSDKQEPLAVLAKYEVRLPLREAEAFLLVLSHEEGNDDAAGRNDGQADTIHTLEAVVLAVAVGDGGVLAKRRPFVLVALVRFTDLSDDTNGHIGRKVEPLAQFPVVPFLKFILTRRLIPVSKFGEPVGGGIEALDGHLESDGLCFIRKKLELER